MKLIYCLASLPIALLIGCGKTAPDQPITPKVEPTEATLTPGIEAAKKAYDEGRYADAVRLYTAELATEEAKPAPSWVQLSYLNNQLGEALHAAGQYDHALEYHQKSLAIRLKQLGPEHPDVGMSYHNIGAVHNNKGEYGKALEHYQKSLAILLKQLGPEHPHVASSYNNIGGVHDNKGEYDKALEYYKKALAIALKQLGPDHPHVANTYNNIGMVHHQKAEYDKALEYFGEAFAEENCGACDNCLEPKETFDGTEAAQKFLACIFRVQQHSHFSVGMNHIVDVLCGADTEKVRNWGHEHLSTHGIGKEYGRPAWKVIGRELVRLGYAHQTPGRMTVLELTAEGSSWLRNPNRDALELTKPAVAKSEKAPRVRKSKAGEIECDEALFEQLRQLRRTLADERGVPPYIIFSDVALRHMAHDYPATPAEFGLINGVGEKKLAEFGEIFTGAIAAFLKENPRREFESSD